MTDLVIAAIFKRESRYLAERRGPHSHGAPAKLWAGGTPDEPAG